MRVARWSMRWPCRGLRVCDPVGREHDRGPGAHRCLGELCREGGRDVGELQLAVSIEGGQPDDLQALTELGVRELVLLAAPPEHPGTVDEWAGELARRWTLARR